MKPTPAGWPRVSSSLYYRDAAAMIDWLCDAFGFEIRLKVEGEGGRIEHSELGFGPDGLVMVGSERTGAARRFGKVAFDARVFGFRLEQVRRSVFGFGFFGFLHVRRDFLKPVGDVRRRARDHGEQPTSAAHDDFRNRLDRRR